MVETLDAGQDSVVFLGRRSFRMELVESPAEDGQGVPRRSSEIPTEKIFDADRNRAANAVLAHLRSRGGISSTTLVTLCSTTFVLGIALTLMVSRRPERRRALEVVPPAAVVVAPASTARAMAAEPVVVALPPPPAPFAIRPTRRPLSKPAPAVRPRPVRPARADSPEVKPWVDPFAD